MYVLALFVAAVLLEESERRWKGAEAREAEAGVRCSEAEV